MSNTKIALGTVQFGMPYGISNREGQTREQEVEEIIQYASQTGIDTMDTAAGYGNSEEVIGPYINHYYNSSPCKIITKTPSFKVERIGDREIDQLLLTFDLSRQKLKSKKVYGLLIHNPEALSLPGSKKLFQAMDKLKSEGLVQKIGASLYSSEQIDYLLDHFPVDLVQLPLNILDQRLIKNGALERIKKQGIEIHARSAFLQGLLLMPINQIHPWFNPIKGVVEKFHLEAKAREMSALQLSLGFVQSIKEVDKVVVGVNGIKQLKEIMDLKEENNLTPLNLTHLSINDPTYLNPSNWDLK